MELRLLLFILALAAFLGFEFIGKVPSRLHTPLMSGSNAISGIIVVGAILAVHTSYNGFSAWLGFAAPYTPMLYGDTKASVTGLVTHFKGL